MKKLLSGLLVLSIAVSAQAEDKKKKKKPAKRAVGAQFFKLPATIDLSGEQKEKIAALRKEYTPKLQELNKKRREAIPAEKLKARRAANKKAAQEGLKGKARAEFVNKETGLTDAELAKMKEINKEQQTLAKEIRGKISEILTADQRSLLKKPKGKGKGKGKKKKKDAAK